MFVTGFPGGSGRKESNIGAVGYGLWGWKESDSCLLRSN